jgi:hypothetical protein
MMGYLQVLIHEVNFYTFEQGQNAARCILSITDDKSMLIKRISSEQQYSNAMHFDEIFEFRCHLDWILVVEILISGASMKCSSNSFRTSNVFISTIRTTSNKIFTIYNNHSTPIGEIKLSVSFIPNQQSFNFLAIECTDELSVFIIDETTKNLNDLIKEDIVMKKEIHSLLDALQVLKSFVQDYEKLSLILANISKQSPSSTPYQIKDNKNIEFNAISNRKLQSKKSETHHFVTIPLYKAANVSKTFLCNLIVDLHQQVFFFVFL